jgi:hypothetical protein
MKAVKILGGIVLGLFGLAVLLFLVALAINWNDQPPSAEALEFQKILDGRPQVPDAENAFVYVLGIGARRDQDPREVGARRMAWLADYTWANRDTPDPAGESFGLRAPESPPFKEFASLCGDADRLDCAHAFQRLGAVWQPEALESLTLERYRTLLGYRRWREVVPQDITAPIPAYSELTYGQRLFLLALLQAGLRGDAAAVREGLEADSRYWRGAMTHASTLISQMIASAALRNHYFFGSLVLQSLPASRRESAIPNEWQREYSAEERSMRLVMAGELEFTRRVFDEAREFSMLEESELEHTMVDKAGIWLTKPFLKKQDTTNAIAAAYAALCRAFEVPLNQYAAAERELRGRARDDSGFAVYNPVGAYLEPVYEPENYFNYVYRTASTEGMRRAALLVAQLRARGVAPKRAAEEVAAHGLRDPYTDLPFEWDAARQSVVFTGPEKHQWRRYEYFY